MNFPEDTVDPQLERQLQRDPFSPRLDHVEQPHLPDATGASDWQVSQPLSVEQIKRHRSVRAGTMIVLGIAAVMLAGFGIFKYQQSAFDQSRVTVKVDAPTAIESTQEVQFSIAYTNDNRATLQNVEATVYYPAGFQVSKMAPGMAVDGSLIRMKLGTIAAHSSGRFDLTGRFSGARDSLAYLKVVLHYTPDNSSSSFEVASQASLSLQSSSLTVDIEAPLDTAADAVAEYLVSYTNTSDAPLNAMRLKATYADGFTFASADPKPSEGTDVWYLGTIAPHQSGKIHISGTLAGAESESKSFHVDFGVLQGDGNFLVFATGDRKTRIVRPPLAVHQTVNETLKYHAHAGERLRYLIDYKNNGSIPLRNVIVTLEMRSDFLDLAGVQSDGGTYDSVNRTIIWKASDIPKLANLLPGDGGSIKFSVPVLNQLSFTGDTGKNPSVMTVARIDSSDIPTPTGANKTVASNTLSVQINSTPTVAVVVLHTDPAVANTGAVPPVVGAETTYSVRLTVSNTTNDIKDAIVKTSLPPNVRWTGVTIFGNESVSYDERSNEISWNLGVVDAGAGSGKPARQIVFQLGFTPAPNQISNVDQSPLLNPVTLTTTDTWTGDALTTSWNGNISLPRN